MQKPTLPNFKVIPNLLHQSMPGFDIHLRDIFYFENSKINNFI